MHSLRFLIRWLLFHMVQPPGTNSRYLEVVFFSHCVFSYFFSRIVTQTWVQAGLFVDRHNILCNHSVCCVVAPCSLRSCFPISEIEIYPQSIWKAITAWHLITWVFVTTSRWVNVSQIQACLWWLCGKIGFSSNRLASPAIISHFIYIIPSFILGAEWERR